MLFVLAANKKANCAQNNGQPARRGLCMRFRVHQSAPVVVDSACGVLTGMIDGVDFSYTSERHKVAFWATI